MEEGSVTILVDFGLLLGADIPTGVFIIGSSTQAIIGTNTIGDATSPVFTQIDTNHVQSISVQRTSDNANGPLTTYNAATATVTFVDLTGAWDPYVLEQAGLTMPGVVMRIRKIFGDITYPVFYGFVDVDDPVAEAPTLSLVTVTATDGFTLLNTPLMELGSPIGPGHNVSTRVALILDAVGWPADLRDIGTTSSTLQQTSYGTSGLDLIQDAVKAEVGEFYQQPDGVMYLRGRTAIVTDPRSATSQAVFGSDRAAGEIPYVGRPRTAWDRSRMHNRVVAQIDGSASPQVAENADSIGRYGTAGIEETGLRLPNDADALSWANYVLAQDAFPSFRFTGITLSSRVEQLGISVMEHMLGRRLGDRVTVVRRPPAQPYGSIVDERELYIQGISHTWDAGSKEWQTTWDLRPVSGMPFFLIGDPIQGVIGQNVIAW
jgi:hypothetical protein